MAAKWALEKYFTCRYFPGAMPGRNDVSLLLRWTLGWAHVLWLTLWLDSMYRLAAAFTVAIGHNKPWEYTPLFGDLASAYTVRRFWGQSWHSLSRRVRIPPSFHPSPGKSPLFVVR